MVGVLNESTGTVHKQPSEGAEFETTCGLVNRVTKEQLARVRVETAVERPETSKCGRCFPDAGGY